MPGEINYKLRDARLKRRWSIRKAAEEVGVAPITFMRWEQGQQNPQLITLDLLCSVFNMLPEDLGFGHLVNGNDVLGYKPKGLKKEKSHSSSK